MPFKRHRTTHTQNTNSPTHIFCKFSTLFLKEQIEKQYNGCSETPTPKHRRRGYATTYQIPHPSLPALPCDCSLAGQDLIDILYKGIAKEPSIHEHSHHLLQIFFGELLTFVYIFAQRTTEIAEMLKRVGETTNH